MCIVVFTTVSALSTHVIDVRLSHNTLIQEKNTLYVNVEIKAEHAMTLAGQNYRIYYPSDALELQQEGSRAQLSRDQYSALQFANVREHLTTQPGRLDYEQDMGFASFYVELLNPSLEGQRIQAEEWVKVARLEFKVKSDVQDLSMVWGRMGLTEQYATAFVEVAEWIAPHRTANVDIDEYIDYNYSHIEDLPEVTVAVGPNPSSDVMAVQLDQVTSRDLSLQIVDTQGRIWANETLAANTNSKTLDISDLASSSYLLVVRDDSTSRTIAKERVMIAR
ncbi:MAG: T9SS type A sorting domain-containing protein [Bacteroidota bacterium]